MNATNAEIREAVLEDIRCHRENGVDLNPYSTNRARRSWQNGFEGKPEGMMDWYVEYKRGQMAAKLLADGA